MSDKPIRIQRKRAKGWRMPPNTVYVGRPSKWGNPFSIGSIYINEKGSIDEHLLFGGIEITDRKIAVEIFKKQITDKNIELTRRELKGKNLACWCPLNQPCHADVLLEIANS